MTPTPHCHLFVCFETFNAILDNMVSFYSSKLNIKYDSLNIKWWFKKKKHHKSVGAMLWAATVVLSSPVEPLLCVCRHVHAFMRVWGACVAVDVWVCGGQRTTYMLVCRQLPPWLETGSQKGLELHYTGQASWPWHPGTCWSQPVVISEVTEWPTLPSFLCSSWGFKFRSSHLWGQSFTDGATQPSTRDAF